MKPKIATSKKLYQIDILGMAYPGAVFATPELAEEFANKTFEKDSYNIKPVDIIIGFEEDETDRLFKEKEALEAKLSEVINKLEKRGWGFPF